jgi:hypothetical protein
MAPVENPVAPTSCRSSVHDDPVKKSSVTVRAFSRAGGQTSSVAKSVNCSVPEHMLNITVNAKNNEYRNSLF